MRNIQHARCSSDIVTYKRPVARRNSDWVGVVVSQVGCYGRFCNIIVIVPEDWSRSLTTTFPVVALELCTDGADWIDEVRLDDGVTASFTVVDA